MSKKIQLKTSDGINLYPYTNYVKNIILDIPTSDELLLRLKGATVLYVGPSTDTHKKGYCYTYTGASWIDVTTFIDSDTANSTFLDSAQVLEMLDSKTSDFINEEYISNNFVKIDYTGSTYIGSAYVDNAISDLVNSDYVENFIFSATLDLVNTSQLDSFVQIDSTGATYVGSLFVTSAISSAIELHDSASFLNVKAEIEERTENFVASDVIASTYMPLTASSAFADATYTSDTLAAHLSRLTVTEGFIESAATTIVNSPLVSAAIVLVAGSVVGTAFVTSDYVNSAFVQIDSTGATYVGSLFVNNAVSALLDKTLTKLKAASTYLLIDPTGVTYTGLGRVSAGFVAIDSTGNTYVNKNYVNAAISEASLVHPILHAASVNITNGQAVISDATYVNANPLSGATVIFNNINTAGNVEGSVSNVEYAESVINPAIVNSYTVDTINSVNRLNSVNTVNTVLTVLNASIVSNATTVSFVSVVHSINNILSAGVATCVSSANIVNVALYIYTAVNPTVYSTTVQDGATVLSVNNVSRLSNATFVASALVISSATSVGGVAQIDVYGDGYCNVGAADTVILNIISADTVKSADSVNYAVSIENVSQISSVNSASLINSALYVSNASTVTNASAVLYVRSVSTLQNASAAYEVTNATSVISALLPILSAATIFEAQSVSQTSAVTSANIISSARSCNSANNINSAGYCSSAGSVENAKTANFVTNCNNILLVLRLSGSIASAQYVAMALSVTSTQQVTHGGVLISAGIAETAESVQYISAATTVNSANIVESAVTVAYVESATTISQADTVNNATSVISATNVNATSIAAAGPTYNIYNDLLLSQVFIVCTQDQYNKLQDKSPGTIYLIKDT